jgi:hypothetical protein
MGCCNSGGESVANPTSNPKKQTAAGKRSVKYHDVSQSIDKVASKAPGPQADSSNVLSNAKGKDSFVEIFSFEESNQYGIIFYSYLRLVKSQISYADPRIQAELSIGPNPPELGAIPTHRTPGNIVI